MSFSRRIFAVPRDRVAFSISIPLNERKDSRILASSVNFRRGWTRRERLLIAMAPQAALFPPI